MEVGEKRNIPYRDVIGTYCESYTPVAGRIISPSLAKKIEYAKFILLADSTVSFKDSMGNSVAGATLLKGKQDFLVSEISASTAALLIIHDGVVAKGVE